MAANVGRSILSLVLSQVASAISRLRGACGRGLSHKQIACAVALTPRTVDNYLTRARLPFNAHWRTELVVSAELAGGVGIRQLARRQPE